MAALRFALIVLSGWGGLFAQLPGGTLVDAPLAGEVATQQIGGAGWSKYSFVGALRCPGGQAMVAVKMRKGSVVDFLQIGCTTVQRDARGYYGWTNANWGASAGSTQGGSRGRHASCNQRSAIVGFMAAFTKGNTYLQDIRFLCAPITGVGQYQSLLAPQRGDLLKPAIKTVQVSDQGRTFAGWISDDDAIRSSSGKFGYSIPKASGDDLDFISKTQALPRSECQGGSASALSVAVGKWVPAWSNVIQAFQMFCSGSVVDTLPGTANADELK